MKPHRYSLGVFLGLVLTAKSTLAQYSFNPATTSDPNAQRTSASYPGHSAKTFAPAVTVIAPGPPALTDRAADSALDFVAFVTSAMTGVDNLEIDTKLKENWRAYLVANYADFDPRAREWYAGTPALVRQLKQSWKLASPADRDLVRAGLRVQLPGILQFVSPVVYCTPRGESRQSLVNQLWDMIQEQKRIALAAYQQQQQQLGDQLRQLRQQQPAESAKDLANQQELYNHQARTTTLDTGLRVSALDTINLMHAMSGR